MHIRILMLLFGFATPYPYVQAKAYFDVAAPGQKAVSMHINLHNTGDLAASCVVKAGGQKKTTGVSANGDAVVWFDSLPSYKGFTVACQVN